jgi:hypothetical protein
MLCGGHSGRKEIEAERREYFNGVRAQVEERLGHAVTQFEPVAYTSQVVAGTIFWLVVRIADGADGHAHVKIFQPLPYTNQGP